MSLERRLAAGALWLAALVPVGVRHLPGDAEAIFLPAAALLAAVVAGVLAGPALAGAALVVVGALAAAVAAYVATPDSAAIALVAPAAALVAGARGHVVLAAAAIAAGAAVLAGAPAGLLGGTVTDRVGHAAAAVAAAGWLARLALAWYRHLRAARVREATLPLHAALDRDRGTLEAVAMQLLDAPEVEGAGLVEDALALATRIDDRRVLLGWLEGDAVQTLTAGWILRASARAGVREPRELLRVVAAELQEVLPEGGSAWLGIHDAARGVLRWAGPAGAGGDVIAARLCVGAHGPHGPCDVPETRHVLEGLVAVEVPVPERHEPGPHLWAASSAWLGVAAVVVLAPSVAAPVLAAAGAVLAAALVRRVERAARCRLDTARAAAEAAIEARAELHHRVARVHGGLLPYRVDNAAVEAVAHRLRGEVLDGAFADLFVDPRGALVLLAGEVPGEGLAPRFMAEAARVRARLAHGAGLACDDARAVALRGLRSEAERLGQPSTLALGVVTVSRDGWCRGAGTLARLVVAERGAAGTAAELRLASGVDCYCTPTPSRPGPEDDAPVLLPDAAAQRLLGAIEEDSPEADATSLPVLFARVFDGQHAPAHGTIVRIALLPGADAAARVA